MFAKLETLEKRYVELDAAMADPAVLADMEQFRKTAKSRADLEPVVLAFREYRELKAQLEENKELLSDDDADIRDMAREEIQRIEFHIALFKSFQLGEHNHSVTVFSAVSKRSA